MPKVEVTNGTVRGDDGQYYGKGQQLELSKERYDQVKAKGDYVKLVRGGSDKSEDEDEQQEEQAPAEPEPDPLPENPEVWPPEDDRQIEDLPDSVHYLNNIKR